MHEGGRKAIIAAFLANLGIAVVKFAAFLVSGAASMLAESIHSVADTGNQGLLLLGAARAKRAPDPRHPFGHARARYFWAFVVAMVLFSLGGLFAIYEGVEKLRHPHELDSVTVPIIVLVIAVVLEGWSFRTAVRESRPLRGNRSWLRFIRETKQPEFPVVLLEDSGALAGLLVALAGLIAAAVTGEPRWDAAGSLVIGVLLVVIAILLAVEMAGLLVGESADPEVEQLIHDAIESEDDVLRVIHLRTNHLGPDDVLVAAKVEFAHHLTVAELAAAIDRSEAGIRAVVPTARLIFLEPDLFFASRAAGAPPEGEPGTA